ncbi:hypothetical protein HK405_003581, partial [Cladochytrium tenue]
MPEDHSDHGPDGGVSEGGATAPETKKAHHVFISYRVRTDGVLAEMLCDKLKSQVVEGNPNGRQLHAHVFLDKEELTSGRKYEDQFLGALRAACLVLPIVSESSLASAAEMPPGAVDNLLREWDLALDLAKVGELVIIPVLVGSNGPDGSYRRFTAFHLIGQMSADRPAGASRSAREIVSSILAVQGVFVDPTDLGDKVRHIAARLTTDVWPTFRHRWADPSAVAPETVRNCVQCGQGFRDSENFASACAFHSGILGQKYQCCWKDDPCKRGKHSASLGSAYAQDFQGSSEFGGKCGIVPNLGTSLAESGQLFVHAFLNDDQFFFMTYTWEDLQAVDPDANLVFMVGTPSRSKTTGCSVTVSWVRSEDGKSIAGLDISAQSPFSGEPVAVRVFLKPEPGTRQGESIVGHLKTITLSRGGFGEKPLGPGGAAAAYPSLVTGVAAHAWAKGAPLLANLEPRDPDVGFPKLSRRLGGCQLRTRMSDTAPARLRSDAPDDHERFAIPVLLINADTDAGPQCVVAASAHWRYRAPPLAADTGRLEDWAGSEPDWVAIRGVTISPASAGDDDGADQDKLDDPGFINVPAGSAVKVLAVLDIPLGKDAVQFNDRSQLACRGSLLFE